MGEGRRISGDRGGVAGGPPTGRGTAVRGAPTVTVRVPATSANLGPGFDSFGLALARYDEVSVSRHRDGPLDVRVSGVGAGRGAAAPPSTSSFGPSAEAYRAAGAPAAGIAPDAASTYPARRRARLVGGRDRRRAAAGPGTARRRRRSAAVRCRRAGAGHRAWRAIPTTLPPLCSAASPWPHRRCTAGRSPSGAMSIPTSGWSCSVPHEASSTHHARGLLPATVPHADAAANAAAAGLLVHALTERPVLPVAGDPVDRLHQHYRAAAMPAIGPVGGGPAERGYPAVVSGAGPSVIALVTGEFDLDRWRRPGFEVAEVAGRATAGDAVLGSPVDPRRRHAQTLRLHVRRGADDVRLLLKAITGCARRSDGVSSRTDTDCEPDLARWVLPAAPILKRFRRHSITPAAANHSRLRLAQRACSGPVIKTAARPVRVAVSAAARTAALNTRPSISGRTGRIFVTETTESLDISRHQRCRRSGTTHGPGHGPARARDCRAWC